MYHICATRDCRTSFMSFEDMNDWLAAVNAVIEAGGSVLTAKTDGEENPFIVSRR